MQKKSWFSLVVFLVFGLLIVLTFLFRNSSLLLLVMPIFFGFIMFYSVIIIVRKTFLFSKGLKKMSQSGLVFSPKVWSWQEGESISLAELFPGMNDMMSSFDQIKLPQVLPQKVAEGKKEGVTYKIFQVKFMGGAIMMPGRRTIPRPVTIQKIHMAGSGGNLNMSQGINILQARATFPKLFPGRLIIQKVNGPTLGRDIDLESVEFNKKVQVYTNQAKIAYQILSPDFMDWYLKLPDQPVIAFDQQTCFYTLFGFSGKGEKEITADIEQLIDRVLHSGALA